jgi:hypothetical protein
MFRLECFDLEPPKHIDHIFMMLYLCNLKNVDRTVTFPQGLKNLSPDQLRDSLIAVRDHIDLGSPTNIRCIARSRNRSWSLGV